MQLLEGIIVIRFHDWNALDEREACLQLSDAVLDLGVGPSQGGQTVLHLPHSRQEVIRGREVSGGGQGGQGGGQLPGPGYAAEGRGPTLGLQGEAVTIVDGSAGAGDGAGGTVRRDQHKCALSLLLLCPVYVQKIRPKKC